LVRTGPAFHDCGIDGFSDIIGREVNANTAFESLSRKNSDSCVLFSKGLKIGQEGQLPVKKTSATGKLPLYHDRSTWKGL
jgi:hypothetical protein